MPELCPSPGIGRSPTKHTGREQTICALDFGCTTHTLNNGKNPLQMPLVRPTAQFHDFEPDDQDFLDAILSGLSHPQKSIPSKFFYDETGSQLFEEICNLDEYYPTRTELGILDQYKSEIAALAGPRCHLAEFGSGSSIKIQTLMQALESPLGYIPIDISREHLAQSAASFARLFPETAVTAICTDYTSEFELPAIDEGQYVGFYPGSTIGNFTPDDARLFLKRVKNILNGGGFIIGVDLVKDTAVLNAAYDDAKGITAAFNKNLLTRCNRELGSNFDLSAFTHRAFFNEVASRIEMHLVSTRQQHVEIAGETFKFEKYETIHTENSYKYTLDGFQTLARSSGFAPVDVWTDDKELFSVHYLAARS